MAKYRKKPLIVDAEQWFPDKPDVRGVCRCRADEHPHVHTIHWRHDGFTTQHVVLTPGDFIIPEPDGEHFYPVKADIFERTYEPVDV